MDTEFTRPTAQGSREDAQAGSGPAQICGAPPAGFDPSGKVRYKVDHRNHQAPLRRYCPSKTGSIPPVANDSVRTLAPPAFATIESHDQARQTPPQQEGAARLGRARSRRDAIVESRI